MDYNKTINLPKTDFPMRAGLPKREPEMLKRWEEQDIYHEMLKKNEGKPLFNLHDGPPLSNGSIHMGTAMNKALKDIITRSYACLLYTSGIAAGALWAMLAGWIKIRFGASEIVITLMLNYVAKLFTEYLVMYPFYVPGSASDSKSTENIAQQAHLSALIEGSQVTTALLISIAVVLIMYIWMHHTVSGFELQLVGSNDRFSKFSGIHVKKRQLQIMALSGGIAGLCGALEILGVHGRFVVNFTSGLGFDGITVALLSGNNPLAIPAAALFMGAMTSGSTQLEMVGGIPRSMASILMGIIIMTVTIKKLPALRKEYREKKPAEHA